MARVFAILLSLTLAVPNAAAQLCEQVCGDEPARQCECCRPVQPAQASCCGNTPNRPSPACGLLRAPRCQCVHPCDSLPIAPLDGRPIRLSPDKPILTALAAVALPPVPCVLSLSDKPHCGASDTGGNPRQARLCTWLN